MGMGIGDWGLRIGDWAQSPIPNPQSPIPNPHIDKLINFFYDYYNFYLKNIKYYTFIYLIKLKMSVFLNNLVRFYFIISYIEIYVKLLYRR